MTADNYADLVARLHDRAIVAGVRLHNEAADAIRDLLAQEAALIERVKKLEAAIKLQARAAISGMDAAKEISSSQLERAARLNAASRPEALESEHAMNASLTEENSALIAERDQLRAELARVSKDAERYRWLSTASMEDWSGLSALTPAALNQWIDAALAAGKGEGGRNEAQGQSSEPA